MQKQAWVETKIHKIACTFYKRKLSELMVLNVKMLIQTICLNPLLYRREMIS